MNTQTAPIWMLEDDQDDRNLTQEIISNLEISAPLIFFSGSDELFSAAKNAVKPALILVDYNSRPLNGKDVLKKIKSDNAFNDIPIVILSEVLNVSAMRECYRLGASSFITKPFTEKQAEEKIKTFFTYWLTVANTELNLVNS